MALGFSKPIEPDDPRLQGHETTYQASRGGWFPAEDKPVPGTPQEETKQ
ncbi:hypothetical protein [Streptomyces stelliscabiei]|nr:hypothetical protein [Streptomyces stelliscabiei]MDX2616129.1 hypothetical protein [Streptomyces stelliscabiei]MDX2634183.1 hypothetical protein [Streptomyces stelliscabiei]MDX2664606.1 hypothetical protein [Streptomyces stelliscabiei]MDX2713831.1 hypothetical protein [Streptomyces stelliscabiei]MDX2785773.1 hypothetical protein [Streptomyces stelliscabiei]